MKKKNKSETNTKKKKIHCICLKEPFQIYKGTLPHLLPCPARGIVFFLSLNPRKIGEGAEKGDIHSH
jgi:hypothetical protein